MSDKLFDEGSGSVHKGEDELEVLLPAEKSIRADIATQDRRREDIKVAIERRRGVIPDTLLESINQAEAERKVLEKAKAAGIVIDPESPEDVDFIITAEQAKDLSTRIAPPTDSGTKK